MLAIIKNEDDSTYVSPVFGMTSERYLSDRTLIVLDSTCAYVKTIEYYRTEKIKGVPGKRAYRQIYIIEWEDFCCAKGRWKGLDWVVNNRKLLKKLHDEKCVFVEDFPDFKPYAKKIELPEWLELCTQNNIDGLMCVSGAFHDGTMEEYAEVGKDIIIKIDTTWGCQITVKFVDVIEADIVDKVGMILDSDIAKTEDGFCWKITEGFAGWTDGVDFDAPFDKPYIKCKKIFWQIEID